MYKVLFKVLKNKKNFERKSSSYIMHNTKYSSKNKCWAM